MEMLFYLQKAVKRRSLFILCRKGDEPQKLAEPIPSRAMALTDMQRRNRVFERPNGEQQRCVKF
jgi:hypothetical protein